MFQTSPLAQLECLTGELRGVLSGLVPGDIPPHETTALWDSFDVIARLGDAGRTLLATRVEEGEQWRRDGHRSAAEHLAHRGGTSTGTARTQLATSRRLARCPHVEAALRRGELSAQQADAIADAADADPGAETRLVELASETSVAELRVECARTKAAADPDPDKRHRRIHRQRRLRQGTNAEGAWWFSGRGTIDAGASFNTVLEPIVDQLFDQARQRGEHVTREALAFDALMELARRMWHTDDTTFNGDDPTDENDDADPAEPDGHGTATTPTKKRKKRRRRSRNNPRYLALLRADLTALTRGRIHDDETCEIAGFGPVPVTTARQLLSDAVLKLVLTNGHDVVNTVHLGRGPNTAQKIALLWTTPTCIVKGCIARRLQHDHRNPWADNQETWLGNIDDHCEHHHMLKTRYGWALVEGTGSREMVPPSDPRHPRHFRQRTPHAA